MRIVRSIRRSSLILLSLLCLPASAIAGEAPRHDLSGIVTAEHSQEPIVGAEVELLEKRKVVRTDSRGSFTFRNLAPGTYHLKVSHPDYAEIVSAFAAPGPAAAVTLDLSFHEEPVVVTASASPEDALRIYQPTSELGRHELEKRGSASLGETLAAEPGVSTSGLGTAPSRPVIRGLGGDRVLILEDGIRVGDVSSLSPDHAVAVNPTEAETIEIVRGPANLLYGSNAIGGAINVINGEIPARRHERLAGSVTFSGSDNTGELAGRASLAGSAGPIALGWGWSRSDAGEFKFDDGAAGNSQYDFTSYHGGASWVGSAGYVGVAYRKYEGNWGIPVDDAGELVSEGEPGVTLALEQDSYKLTGQYTRPFGIFAAGRLQAGKRDYTHTEFEESGEPGTTFNLDTFEARADVTHKEFGRLKGTWGVWLLDGQFEGVGDEAILPHADTRGYAGFFYEELTLPKVNLLFGGRYDDHEVDPGPTGDRRTFSAASGAIGAVVNPKGRWTVAGNVTRNFKAPGAEELFGNGPHVATFTFEVGDPDLDEETSTGYDLSFRWNTKRFRGEVTGFHTDFTDYIFLDPDPAGAVDPDSGLPIAYYRQADATFQGLELHADVSLLEHLTLELVGDNVRATNDDTGEPLPRIPPYRLGLGINRDTDRYGFGAEARHAGPQTRTAPGEQPTDAWTIYNAFAHVQMTGGRVVHRISLRGENLTDRLYRNHVSLVKEIVPQPGRIARIDYTVYF